MTATRCLTSGKPESPRCAGDSFHTPSHSRPAYLMMMKTKCWAAMWLGTSEETRDRAQAWVQIQAPLYGIAVAGHPWSPGLSWRCTPFFYSCATSCPCTVAGIGPAQATVVPRVPRADARNRRR